MFINEIPGLRCYGNDKPLYRTEIRCISIRCTVSDLIKASQDFPLKPYVSKELGISSGKILDYNSDIVHLIHFQSDCSLSIILVTIA